MLVAVAPKAFTFTVPVQFMSLDAFTGAGNETGANILSHNPRAIVARGNFDIRSIEISFGRYAPLHLAETSIHASPIWRVTGPDDNTSLVDGEMEAGF